MRQILSHFQGFEIKRHLLPAIVLGVGWGFFVNGYWLVDVFPAGSKSLLFLTILAGLIGILVYCLLFQWIKKALSGLSNVQKAELAGLSLFTGVFLFFTVTDRWQEPDRYIDLFLPTHTLEVSIPPDGGTDAVSILWISTSLGDVSYSTVGHDGWNVIKDRLVLTNLSDNHLRWEGKTGQEIQLVFETPSQTGYAVITWDGHEEILQFSRKKNSHVHAFEIPFYASREWMLLLGILNFSFLSFPLCFLVFRKRVEIFRAVQHSLVVDTRQTVVRDWVLVMVLMVLAFVLRAPGLENLFPSVEEYSHLNAAKQIIQGAPIQGVYQRSMWLVTLPITLMFRMFGYELWAARLLGVIFNVLAVVPLYFIARRLGRPVAFLSVLLYATSPWVIAMSRVVREYAYYPFYYYWIVYGMIVFLERIPDRFHIDRDWKTALTSKQILLVLGLALPPLYALSLDTLSTFKLILIAYAVLGLFTFLKLDFRYRGNLPAVIAMALAILMSAYLWWERFPVKLTVNLVPLDYFFLNSSQQWYFDRAAIIPLLGFWGTMIVGIVIRRINIIPVFLLALYGGFLGFFMFSSNRFFAPRHLSTAELWYVILMAIGCYLIWIFLQTFPLPGSRRTWIFTIVILGGLAFNFQHSLLPIISRDSLMPITGDYHNDLTELQTFMLANVKDGDVLICSRIYGRYVEWVDEPDFQTIYDFQVQTMESDVFSIVDQYESGWIIIDDARIERTSFSPQNAFLNDDRMEYIGLFDDEHVWRWGVK